MYEIGADWGEWVRAQPTHPTQLPARSCGDGWIGWAAIAAVIVAWNGRCIRNQRHQLAPHEMLSEFASRHKVVFVPGGMYLAFHFGKPRWLARFDPLHLIADRLCSLPNPKE